MDEFRRRNQPLASSAHGQGLAPDDPTQRAALLQISHSLLSHDPKETATQIVTQALILLDAEAGFLRVVEPAPEAWPWAVAVDAQGGELPQPQPLSPGQGLAGWVAQAGQPALVADVQDEPRWDPALDGLEGIVARGAVLVPVVHGDRPVGVLGVLNAREGRAFAAHDAWWLEFCASQVAIAVEMACIRQQIAATERAQSEMLDFVAHELRQPMTAMQGYAKMLSMGIGGELSPTQKQFAGVIHANVERMGKLVNDLLEISRLDAGRTKVHRIPVGLGQIVADVAERLRDEFDKRRHTLIVNVPDSIPPVLGDRERLEQVTAALLQNAAMYTPDGGTILVMVDQPTGAHARVAVQDTGIGMSAEEIARLERRFFRAGHELVKQQVGSGLGLAIARKVLELHGGEWEVESEPGRGSLFRFTVPLAPEQ